MVERPGFQRLGILGGFGSLAGAHFYRRLVDLTPAAGDSDHIPVVLVTDPSTPSRLLHLDGRGPSPTPNMVAMAQTAVRAGADLLVIPSATCHAYYDELTRELSVPLLHLPTVVMEAAAAASVRHIALLATTPTVRLGLYVDPARKHGIAIHTPDPATQDEVMAIIADVKAGVDAGAAFRRLAALPRRPWAAGTDAILLGCTELPAVFPHAERSRDFLTLDATDELARAVIRRFGAVPG
jgi:aspartate racemase